ncbi:myelin-associated glycoprotein [Chaetodon trifascialis]|uniref:myelin-associated glycoprotein n=1 Tax=Chaetodon trifascialis TaxID=109706 RepID=UPI0039957EC2
MGVGLLVAALFIALMQGVFGKTWNVMMPRTIRGISGSCVTIPCHFEVPDSEERDILNCSDRGMWRRGSLSGPPVAKSLQVRVIGDVTRKNCTTMFHGFSEDYSDTFFYRLECTEKLKFTFSSGVNIIVRSGVPPPKVTSEGTMSEGGLAVLHCSVQVPCTRLPPSITWLPRDSSREEQTLMQQNADRQMIMKSTVAFIASADPHTQSIACSVSYPLTKGGSTEPSIARQRLNVLYAPRSTVATLSTPGPVSEGHTVKITCSSDANPPVSNYTWYRVETGQLSKRGEGEILVLKVKQGDSGAYLCEALAKMGSQRSNPVSLQVATADSSSFAGGFLYSVCGVMLLLYILTAAVSVYKYHSLSRRLKVELKGEHTYADLRASNVASDYDQLQPRQPKTTPPETTPPETTPPETTPLPDDPNYENLQTLSFKPKTSRTQVDVKE